MNAKKTFTWAALLFAIVAIVLLASFFILDQQQEPLKIDAEVRQKAAGNFISLSKGTTHYLLAGPENGKPLVLIHGGMVLGMYAWRKNIDFLTNKGYRVLMYDLYGRGYSDRVEEEYTPALLFTQFEELMDSVKLERPFSIAALSLGSMVAIEYTRRHPEEVEKLMLLSPVARGKGKINPALRIPLLSDLLMAGYWFPRAVNKQMEEFHLPENFPEYEEKLREMVRYKGYKSSNYSTWLHTLSYNMEPQIEEVGKHKIPIALVLGEHDPYVTKDEAATYNKLLPLLKLYEVENVGHVVNYEGAQTVNKLMHQFFSHSALPEVSVGE